MDYYSGSQDSSQLQSTQVVDDDFGLSQGTVATEEEEEPEKLAPVFWGELVALKEGLPFVRLQGEEDISMGRSSKCSVVLKDFNVVSSRHCRLFSRPSDSSSNSKHLDVFIVDSSANGTYVNGLKMKKGAQRLLSSGDRISLAVHPQSKQQAVCVLYMFKGPEEQEERGESSRGIPTCSATDVATRLIDAVSTTTTAAAAAAAAASASSSSTSTTTTATKRRRQFRIEDHYELRRQLGSGAQARVVEAVDRETGQAYAVKIMEKRKLMQQPNFTMEKLKREAELLRRMDHPHVTKFRDIHETPTMLYIVMELVSGGDLFEHIINHGHFSEAVARDLFGQIMAGIKYLHDRNIVHRDLKPENILVMAQTQTQTHRAEGAARTGTGTGEEGRGRRLVAKITDFGLASVVGGEGLRTFCGTPQYFAPELLGRAHTVLGVGRYGKPVDMWAVGVILYVMLSGTPPFSETTLFKQIQAADFGFHSPVWRTVSAAAKGLVRSLIVSNPHTRLTADEVLAHPWMATCPTPVETARSAATAAAAAAPAVAAPVPAPAPAPAPAAPLPRAPLFPNPPHVVSAPGQHRASGVMGSCKRPRAIGTGKGSVLQSQTNKTAKRLKQHAGATHATMSSMGE